MKTYMNLSTAPTGVKVTTEGAKLRIYFDYVAVEPTEANPSEGQYQAEFVEVNGVNYEDVVSAIVKDRYPADLWQSIMANYQDTLDANTTLTEEKITKYTTEYNDFQAWRKRAKEIASVIKG